MSKTISDLIKYLVEQKRDDLLEVVIKELQNTKQIERVTTITQTPPSTFNPPYNITSGKEYGNSYGVGV